MSSNRKLFRPPFQNSKQVTTKYFIHVFIKQKSLDSTQCLWESLLIGLNQNAGIEESSKS